MLATRLLQIGLMGFLLLTDGSFHSAWSFDRIHRTNTAYEVGDWISYSMTRFVNIVAPGNQYIYFGTTGGILRYDFWANNWDFPWTRSNGLAANDARVVAFDPFTSMLWCATPLSVSYLEPATGFWNNLYYDELGLHHDEIVLSIGINDQDTWLQTSQGRYLSSDPSSVHFSFRNDVSQTDLTEGSIAWYGVKGGKKSALPYFFLSNGYVYNEPGYIEDSNFRTWPITTSITDKWNNAWIGTWGLGCWLGNLSTQRLELLDYGLFDLNVKTIAFDQNGLWLGGLSSFNNQSGVTYWDLLRKRVTYYEPTFIPGFNSGRVLEIAVDGDNVWFATEFGLTHYNTKKDHWYTYYEVDHLTSDYLYDVVLNDDSIWLATASGVSRIIKNTIGTDSMTVEWIGWHDLKNVEVYDIQILEHLVWMATEWGIYVYNTSQKIGSFFNGPDGAISVKVTAVSAYGDEVWFGTEDGIEAFNLTSNDWLAAPARQYQTKNRVHCIQVTREAVWAGTDAGVLKFNRARNYWRLFTTFDGLIDNAVYSIAADGDYIWFGTAKGITRFYWNNPNRID